MTYNSKKKLVVLSGPSCVGKGPLKQAVRRYRPEIKLAEVVLCTSRKPRFNKWSDPLGIEAEKVLDEFVEILRS